MPNPKDTIKKQSYQLDVDDNDGLPEADKNQDIKQKQKVTIGQYIGEQSQKNTYPIDDNVNSDNTSNKFADDFGNDKTYSYSEYLSNAEAHSNYVKQDISKPIKSKQKGTSKTQNNSHSNDVLTNQKDGSAVEPKHTYGNSVLKGYNRFDVETRFRNSAQAGGMPIQKNLGMYNPIAPRIAEKTMQEIGSTMTMLNTGDADLNGIAPAEGVANVEALGLGGMAGNWRKNDQELSAKAALQALLGNSVVSNTVKINSLNNPDLDSPNQFDQEWYSLSKSSGNMTNVDQQFSGLLPTGVIVLHVALFFLMYAGITVLLLLVATIARPQLLNRTSKGKYKPGIHLSHSDGGGFLGINFGDISKFMGIQPVMFDFGECVNEGIFEFFGFDGASSFGEDAIFDFALSQPGYFATFSRMFFRSMNSVGEAIERATKKGSFASMVGNITGIVDAIRDAKIIKMLNYFAIIGEKRIQLKVTKLYNKQVTSGQDSIKTNISPLAHRENNDNTGKSNRLSMRCGNTPGALLIPKKISAAGTKANPYTTAVGAYYKRDGGNRLEKIDPQTRRDIEARLEAEYVPFYFHDLRTNEIISFHAFLETVTDSYTPSYNQINGMGRVEPVQVYKGTTRAVSLTFSVISTNHDDFDIMYQKINKLVTMVYPQFSAGTAVNVNGKTMSMPFSQIPAASPLIRLRVGDLIKTNYSRFALKRLFQTQNDASEQKPGAAETDATNATNAYKNHYDRMSKKKFQINDPFLLRPNTDPASSTFNVGYTLAGAGKGVGNVLPILNAFSGDDYTEPKVLKITSPIRVKYLSETTDSNVPMHMVEILDPKIIKNYKSTSPLPFSGKQENPIVLVSADDLMIDDVMLKLSVQKQIIKNSTLNSKNAKKIINGGNNEYDELLGEKANFTAANNPIVRAFEDNAGGKGLPGVITSLNFDWNATWETTIYGSVAPKYCKISISFTPTHDIAPGIDHEGFNRAPLYNAGRIMNGIGGDGDNNVGSGRAHFDGTARKVNEYTNKKENK